MFRNSEVIHTLSYLLLHCESTRNSEVDSQIVNDYKYVSTQILRFYEIKITCNIVYYCKSFSITKLYYCIMNDNKSLDVCI